ncbi:pentatricopeptide repeat-containing protein At2g20710, mitochondrial-like isoform X4 [Arachis duranensis]|uniref:Pentatricopeptide repeat-containing protein At2g20710, mitochondrial-like isoform X4 n=1 Tax=Arachis duranensis TaxID=130453 RepID=A0A6P4CHV2_ARADU|nr:pentatricopeptide repeat-containing protein At2g20710, mitochondrial-like isoform X4 [Arachis duranensis]
MVLLTRLRSALRLLPRSSATYATSAASTSNLSPAKRNQSANVYVPQDLYRRIFIVTDPTLPVVTILEQWVQDGRTLSYNELVFVIKQLRSRKRYKNALEVSFWMSEKGYSEPRSSDFSLKLDLIAKVKGIEEAESYFDSIPNYLRTTDCYSTLLNCYAQVRDVDKAKRIMLQMRHLGFAGSTLARNALLNLYYQTQNYDKVENLLLEMKEEGIKFDRFTFSTLINTYAAKSDIEGIDKLLAQLEDDPSYSQHADWWSVYAVAANCYGKLGLHDKAFNALKKSEERLSSTIWKEAFPYLVTQYATIGKKEEVMRLWKIYKMDGKLLKRDYYSTVISSFLKLDDIELAKSIFEEWESRNRYFRNFFIPNMMIAAYSRKGNMEEAEAIVNRTIMKGGKPNLWTWSRLLLGYIPQRNFPMSVRCMKEAVSIYEVGCKWKPLPESLAAIFQYLKFNGDMEEAEDLIRLLSSKNIISLDVHNNLTSWIKDVESNVPAIDVLGGDSHKQTGEILEPEDDWNNLTSAFAINKMSRDDCQVGKS